MLIKIALNGARSKTENKYIPHSLGEIEREVRTLFNYGCKVLHIHCYDKNGKESLKPEDVSNLVSLIKSISPYIQLGISSGDWVEPDYEKRKSYLKAWEKLPDFISINMIENNAVETANLLLSKGILIEAGLNEKRAAEIFVECHLFEGCCRILIEPEEDEFEPAIKTVNEIESILDKSNIKIPRLLHGFNAICWDMLREAARKGYDSRIGMEDTIYLESKKIVKSNLELIQYANKIVRV